MVEKGLMSEAVNGPRVFAAAALVTTFLLAVIPGSSARAQTDEPTEPAGIFAYVTYFECSAELEMRADEIVNTSFVPYYDAAVERGDIIAWVWMRHYLGGHWRRSLAIVGENMADLLAVSGQLGETIDDRVPGAAPALRSICGSHDDYVWETIPGIGGARVPGEPRTAVFSVYMQCDMAREERVDELVRDVLTPLYDRQLGEGELISWNWYRHNIGGKYRRLLTMGAGDRETLLQARAKILAEYKKPKIERAIKEINTICHTHQDYLWDVVEVAI